jgi:hypothetical protein
MSPVAADRASADSAPGAEAEEPDEVELGDAAAPLETEELAAEEAADWLEEDPQPAATSEKAEIAAAHPFRSESMPAA